MCIRDSLGGEIVAEALDRARHFGNGVVLRHCEFGLRLISVRASVIVRAAAGNAAYLLCKSRKLGRVEV